MKEMRNWLLRATLLGIVSSFDFCWFGSGSAESDGVGESAACHNSLCVRRATDRPTDGARRPRLKGFHGRVRHVSGTCRPRLWQRESARNSPSDCPLVLCFFICGTVRTTSPTGGTWGLDSSRKCAFECVKFGREMRPRRASVCDGAAVFGGASTGREPSRATAATACRSACPFSAVD